MTRSVEATEAFEVLVGGDGSSPIVITCEHATAALPEPWRWADEDGWLADTHWAWDPGAEDVVRELAEALGAAAVVARFTRLVCDANRALSDPTMFRGRAEGQPVQLNAGLDADARAARQDRLWRPYHDAITRTLAAFPGRVVLSVHTFTPLFEGTTRDVEVGVLYDRADDLAVDWSVALTDRDLRVWLNEPYSGKEGLIYSAESHAQASGRDALELEIRNDLATDPIWRAVYVPKIAAALLEALSGGVE